MLRLVKRISSPRSKYYAPLISNVGNVFFAIERNKSYSDTMMRVKNYFFSTEDAWVIGIYLFDKYGNSGEQL